MLQTRFKCLKTSKQYLQILKHNMREGNSPQWSKDELTSVNPLLVSRASSR